MDARRASRLGCTMRKPAGFAACIGTRVQDSSAGRTSQWEVQQQQRKKTEGRESSSGRVCHAPAGGEPVPDQIPPIRITSEASQSPPVNPSGPA